MQIRTDNVSGKKCLTRQIFQAKMRLCKLAEWNSVWQWRLLLGKRIHHSQRWTFPKSFDIWKGLWGQRGRTSTLFLMLLLNHPIFCLSSQQLTAGNVWKRLTAGNVCVYEKIHQVQSFGLKEKLWWKIVRLFMFLGGTSCQGLSQKCHFIFLCVCDDKPVPARDVYSQARQEGSCGLWFCQVPAMLGDFLCQCFT